VDDDALEVTWPRPCRGGDGKSASPTSLAQKFIKPVFYFGRLLSVRVLIFPVWAHDAVCADAELGRLATTARRDVKFHLELDPRICRAAACAELARQLAHRKP
jgi:hypothetical protein